MGGRNGRPATDLEIERRRQGYSQDLLAKTVERTTGFELTQWRLSLLERGVWPTLEERRAIAQTLRVGESYIFPPTIYGPPAKCIRAEG